MGEDAAAADEEANVAQLLVLLEALYLVEHVRRVLLGEVRETRRGRGAVQRRAAQVAHLLVCLQAGDLIPRENTEQGRLQRRRNTRNMLLTSNKLKPVHSQKTNDHKVLRTTYYRCEYSKQTENSKRPYHKEDKHL